MAKMRTAYKLQKDRPENVILIFTQITVQYSNIILKPAVNLAVIWNKI